MTRMKIAQQLLSKIYSKKQKPLVVVETGTIRNATPRYQTGDGWSTLYIAKWIANNSPESQFFSIDLDHTASLEVLSREGLQKHVIFLKGDSREMLKTIELPIDFCLLDSANDENLILEEFQIVEDKISPGGFVLIDDVILNSTTVRKGLKVIPYVNGKYSYHLTDRMAYIEFPQ